jgi:hypothetical protein
VTGDTYIPLAAVYQFTNTSLSINYIFSKITTLIYYNKNYTVYETKVVISHRGVGVNKIELINRKGLCFAHLMVYKKN